MPLQTQTTPITTQITWIPVTDSLPTAFTTVLVHIPKTTFEPVWFGYYDTETGFWLDNDGSRFRFPVTHWASLPEPPNS